MKRIPPTRPSHLLARSERSPERPALAFVDRRRGRTWQSYQQVYQRAARDADGLAERGDALELEQGWGDWLPGPSIRGDDVVALPLTSGTTGFPKICVWKQERVIAAPDGMAEAMNSIAPTSTGRRSITTWDWSTTSFFVSRKASRWPLWMLWSLSSAPAYVCKAWPLRRLA